jgi:sporulation protein YlmC with PRC-barrel domain
MMNRDWEVVQGMKVYSSDGKMLGIVELVGHDSFVIADSSLLLQEFTVDYDEVQNVQGERIVLKESVLDCMDLPKEGTDGRHVRAIPAAERKKAS